MRIPQEADQRQREQGFQRSREEEAVLAPQLSMPRETTRPRPIHEWPGQSRVGHLGNEESEGRPRIREEAIPNSKVSMQDHGAFHLDDAADHQLCFSGRRFADLGEPLMQSLQQLVWERHCKVMPMVADQIYPLPLRDYDGVPPELQSWLRAVLLGLNSLSGCSSLTGRAEPSKLQQKVVMGLLPSLERMCSTEERVPSGGFRDLFNVKGVDYRGEEIKLAMSFRWPNIKGALPKEVATLELAEFCTDGCRHFVNDFRRFLVPESQQLLGRTPRVMVADEDWFEVCQGLLSSGICGVLPREELFHIGGSPLLNGMFAVSKNEFQDGLELQRLIMNLVPLNRNCVSVKGDVATLPTTAGFSAFYLLDNEVAVMSSEDVKCFYYLFRVPDNWCPFMGFAKELPAGLVPDHLRGKPCHLVSRVLPMGWSNSVGLAQHIHRNIVEWSMTGLQAGFGEQELRRDRTTPLVPRMHRVYLDNWDEIRRVDKHLVEEVEGAPSPHQLALRHQYELLDVPRHPKKSVESSCQAEIQGAILEGQAGVPEVHGFSLGIGTAAEMFPQGATNSNWGVGVYHYVPKTIVERTKPCLGTYGSPEAGTACRKKKLAP